jgi:hypothetical protein
MVVICVRIRLRMLLCPQIIKDSAGWIDLLTDWIPPCAVETHRSCLKNDVHRILM